METDHIDGRFNVRGVGSRGEIISMLIMRQTRQVEIRQRRNNYDNVVE